MENCGEQTKKTYTSPVLTEYGSLEKLTLGAAGGMADAGGGTFAGG
jgi:hypothetical protein